MERTAIVTGGASGIGRALSEALVERGVRVVLADIDIELAEETARGAGELARAERLDVTDADAVRSLVRSVASEHGSLDYMFNNAGIGVGGEETDVTVDDWMRVLDVDLRGVVYGTKAAYDVMVEQGSGHIINTASLAGLVPMPGLVSYAAAKHGVVGLSTSLRYEAELHGVRVSVACPGLIDTPMQQNIELVNMDRDEVLENQPFEPYPAEACARDILRGVDRNRAIIIVTRHARMVNRAYKFFPAVFSRFMTREVRRTRERLLKDRT